MERTFCMIKPEGVKRGLVGSIITRLENKGYKIVAIKMLRISPELASNHYAEHHGKVFYQDLVNHITSGPVVAMVLEGPGVIAGLRQMMGATNPKDAAPGTIRGDYAVDLSYNVIHGADSPQSAIREISLFFTSEELQ